MPPIKYAVVAFINDDAASDEEIASEVPISWLSANQKQCWWPKGKNLNTLITKSVSPKPDDPKWELHDVNCQGFYETLEVARKRAETIHSSSDEREKSSRALRKKVTRTVSPILDSESSSCSSEVSNMKLPEFPTAEARKTVACLMQRDTELSPQCSGSRAGQIRKNTSQTVTVKSSALLESQTRKDSTINTLGPREDKSNQIIKSNRTARDSSVADISLNDILLNDIPIIFNEPADLHTKIVKTIEGLHVTVIQTIADNFAKAFSALAALSLETSTLSERLGKIEQIMTKSNTGPDAETFVEISTMLPFKTTENIKTFEDELLANPDLMDKLVKYLSQIGGNTPKENIIRIMRRVFTNSVAQQSSWLALRNNFKISGLKTILAIKAAVTSRFTFTDKDFEEIASEWLRQAKQRLVREQKKKTRTSNTNKHVRTTNNNWCIK